MPDDASRPPIERLASAAARAGGAALGALFGGVATVRRSKPLHPRGALLRGTIRRGGSSKPSSVPWIDEAGTDDVLVRLSRATGLPAPSPDFFGLAVRLHLEDRPVDLLFASTGAEGLGRFLLIPRRSLGGGPLTTLLPVRTVVGPLLLAARPLTAGRELPDGPDELAAALEADPLTVELSHSGLSGAWHPFAVLEIDGPADVHVDPLIRFEPVINTLPGVSQYPWVGRLREPAYARARDAWPRPSDEVEGPSAVPTVESELRRISRRGS